MIVNSGNCFASAKGANGQNDHSSSSTIIQSILHSRKSADISKPPVRKLKLLISTKRWEGWDFKKKSTPFSKPALQEIQQMNVIHIKRMTAVRKLRR